MDRLSFLLLLVALAWPVSTLAKEIDEMNTMEEWKNIQVVDKQAEWDEWLEARFRWRSVLRDVQLQGARNRRLDQRLRAARRNARIRVRRRGAQQSPRVQPRQHSSGPAGTAGHVVDDPFLEPSKTRQRQRNRGIKEPVDQREDTGVEVE